MRRLIYLSSARDDLDTIFDHIADEAGSARIAEAFVGRIINRCEYVAGLPGILGTARPELRTDIRSMPHQGYVIFFRCHGSRMEIVNVLNARRDIIRYFDEN